jgi:hypothetical protein
VEALPIALRDFRLGIDKIAADAGVVTPEEPRVRLENFTRGVARSLDRPAAEKSVFLLGVQAGLTVAARDEFRLPLPGDLIRDQSRERFAGGLVAGALVHEWLRGDRRAATELDPMYAYGQGVGFQVNQQHLCAHDPDRTRLVHRVSCVYVEKRHGAIPLHTEMFLVAWLLRVCGYRTDEIDMEGYLRERVARWNWMPPLGSTSAS